MQLVLDGLDRLAPKATSFLFLQTLTHEPLPHLRLIMLSREEPPFGLQEFKIKQQVYILTNEDLAFRVEETRSFFRETRKVSLNPSQVAGIQSSTEGWVGGLVLFSEALERLPEGERERYIAERIPNQFRQEAFRFFEEVILSSQPSEIRDFLIKSSILDKMEAEFIGDLLETKEMEKILQDAARKHLFVQSSYEEGKGWVFRYHQLFQDFLQMKFKTEFSSEKQKALYLKTGLLLQKGTRQEEAIRFFLKAEDYKSAVFEIEKIGYDLFIAGRLSDLQEWLQALPEEIIQRNPWLLYYLSLTRMRTAPAKNMVSFYQALNLFEKAGDVRGCLVSLTGLINATTLSGHDLVPMIEMANKGENLLRTMGRDLYPRERSNLWGLIGLGFICFHPQKAYQAAQNAYLIARETKEPVLQIYALMRIFQILLVQHEIYRIDEISKETENLLKKYPYHPLEISYRVFRGIYSFSKGDLEKSETEFEYAKKECQRLGLSYLYTINLREYMILKMNLGQYQEAEDLGQHLLQLSTTLGQTRQTGIILYNLGRNRYFEGDYKKAEEYLEQSYEILSAEGSSYPWYLYRINVLRGFMAIYNHPNESIFKDLQNALDYSLSVSSGYSFEAHFALALLSWQKKDKKKTAFHLRSGFEIAKEKGDSYFPYISPRDKARIYALAVEIGDEEQCDQVLKILSTRPLPQAEPELERLSKHSDPNIRAKAAKIKLALHRSTLPRLRIETLGGFRVLRSSSPVKEEEWHGSEPKTCSRPLWPRERKGSGRKSLWKTSGRKGNRPSWRRILKVSSIDSGGSLSRTWIKNKVIPMSY
ncbi:MAG: tetratricopeptide repeat protein [Deltaproteobacteria bacterium]|nr:tetratricopeptide repeat protein [Deltaproteobacteria bacterium]